MKDRSCKSLAASAISALHVADEAGMQHDRFKAQQVKACPTMIVSN
jgi:hypothetical protein